MIIVLVALGGAIGAVLRSTIADVVGRGDWPRATIAANTIASFMLGLVPDRSAALTVGLIGALSTWSTLALELFDLNRKRGLAVAMTVAAVSVVLGVGAAWLGLELG